MLRPSSSRRASPMGIGACFSLASLCLTGCADGVTSRNGGAEGEPIARVGDRAITVEDLQKRIDEQSPFVRTRFADPEKKRELLDGQVRFELLAREALERGYDRDPEVQEAVKKIIVQKLTREAFDAKAKTPEVSDEELKAYFDAHQGDYQKPEMVRASVLTVAAPTDGAGKAKARAAIEEAHRAATGGKRGATVDRNTFKALVAKTSTDEASKRTGGDLRYLSAADVEQRFGAAAKAWLFGGEATDEVSPIIEGADAFHIFLRTGRREPITRTFEQVRSQIKNVVAREKRNAAFSAFVAGLEKKHGVEVYAEKLDKLRVTADPSPASRDADPHALLNGLSAGDEEGADAP